jgi:hypothetical protein
MKNAVLTKIGSAVRRKRGMEGRRGSRTLSRRMDGMVGVTGMMLMEEITGIAQVGGMWIVVIAGG